MFLHVTDLVEWPAVAVERIECRPNHSLWYWHHCWHETADRSPPTGNCRSGNTSEPRSLHTITWWHHSRLS